MSTAPSVDTATALDQNYFEEEVDYSQLRKLVQPAAEPLIAKAIVAEPAWPRHTSQLPKRSERFQKLHTWGVCAGYGRQVMVICMMLAVVAFLAAPLYVHILHF